MTFSERVLGALWGSVVGDALGVPVEFTSRADRKHDPVTSMRGYGTWNQPEGTWSDDTSLMLASAESLLEGFDIERMGQAFVDWLHGGKWRPHGRVFDVGMTTRQAIDAILSGGAASTAGSTLESSNGNGSLMRILPVGLAFANAETEEICEAAESASAITHGHAWSRMACAYACLLTKHLIQSGDKFAALAAANHDFISHYSGTSEAEHLGKFSILLQDPLSIYPDHMIESSGFVLHTLTASVWCLLRETTFAATVLQAVNLGDDTDTTGCVTGGFAGLLYGQSEIPADWFAGVARHDELAPFFQKFTTSLLEEASDS